MAKIYMGIDGSYEIYNKTSIIKRMINKNGAADDKYKVYGDINNIPNEQDRLGIEQALSVVENPVKRNQFLAIGSNS
jgi:hypothetical protein